MAKDCEQVLFVTFAKDGVYHIQCSGLVPGPGHVCCTLVIGEEKCLLIDNGFGDDDFGEFPPELVPLMQGKELVCAATHGHRDHIGGAHFFDEIWIMPEEESVISDFLGKSYDPEKKLICGRTKVRDLTDGQVFELGGRKVTAIATPGHTWGSCCFYDDKAKLMMTGDALNRHVMYQLARPAVPLCLCAERLENLLAYQFDLFLGGHHPEPFPRSFVTYMVQLIRSFDISKSTHYDREGFPENISIYKIGRGYGDPAYASFIFDADRLEEYMR